MAERLRKAADALRRKCTELRDGLGRFYAVRVRKYLRRIFTPQALFYLLILTLFWFCRYSSQLWQFDNCRPVPWGQACRVLLDFTVLSEWFNAACMWMAIYFLTLLVLPKLVRNIVLTMFVAAEAVIGLADFYMVVWYACPMKDMIAILRATDRQEIREFFGAMIYHGNVLLPAVLLLVVVGLCGGVFFGLHKLRSVRRCRTADAAAGAMLLLTFFLCGFDVMKLPDPLLEFVTKLQSEDPFLRKVSLTVADPKLPPGIGGVLKEQKAPVLGMIVIGESDNRHHHSLYGYEKDTDVFLREGAGKMIRFTDAISATSSTIHSIFFMLTDARIQTKYEWPHYAVCEYFRKLGVARISLHDMQRSHGAWSSVTSMLFVNADLRRSYSDDGRNHCDGEMLENVAADCADDPGGAKMIFVHLMGSHYDQRYRVPEEWLQTHGSAVSGMDFYDKSIVYTGFVIAELRKMTDKSARPAFLLYIPDHSEEPDSRRSSTVPDPVYYEIPMYLFFNAAYEREYPEIVALARQAADKPFQTDLTLQLIARLMGVPETLLKPEEDLLSPGYKPPVRLIGMGEIPYPEKTAPKRK